MPLSISPRVEAGELHACRQADLSTCNLIEALCDSTDLINHL
jgi:hypothetical protein